MHRALWVTQMKNFKILGTILFFVLTIGCSSTYELKTYKEFDILELTDFCELDELKSGQFVMTKTFYTGVDEYWGLTSNNNCHLDHQIHLSTEENHQKQLNNKLSRKFQKLYSNYWKYMLELQIIGKLEKTNEELGYGHLGLYKIQIIPYQIKILRKHKMNRKDWEGYP